VSDPTLHDLALAWRFTIFGVAVVFTALSLVSGAVWLFQKLETWKPTSKTAEVPADPGPIVEAGISPEIVAAIGAALSASLGEHTRIHHIRYRRGAPEATWSREGRLSIMASHRLR
jgi:Na+-transporting methylmalonyl-CoA/oxaloacetate decarboxylase gamma subunit